MSLLSTFWSGATSAVWMPETLRSNNQEASCTARVIVGVYVGCAAREVADRQAKY